MSRNTTTLFFQIFIPIIGSWIFHFIGRRNRISVAELDKKNINSESENEDRYCEGSARMLRTKTRKISSAIICMYAKFNRPHYSSLVIFHK